MRSTRQKILIISPFNIFPPYWGGASRIYNLAKYLAKEYKVVLLCNEYKQIKKANIDCNEYYELSSNANFKLHFVKSPSKFSQIFNPFLILEGIETIKNEKPDIILAEFAWSGFHAIVLGFISQVPYILDEHNVEFLRFERMKRGNRITQFMIKLYEKLACTFASKIFCVSEVDRDFLISKLGIKKEKIVIVPNGVDTNKFYPDVMKREKIRQKLGIDRNTPLFLFFGKLDYKPNLEAVNIIYYKILPNVFEKEPEAKVIIVGNGSLGSDIKKLKHKNPIFVGFAERIQDYINTCDFVICPLISGGGTRIKILESIACGKQVISTSLGAEGLINEATKGNLIIADDWNQFSKEVVKLIRTKTTKVPKKFRSAYDWGKIVKKVEQHLK